MFLFIKINKIIPSFYRLSFLILKRLQKRIELLKREKSKKHLFAVAKFQRSMVLKMQHAFIVYAIFIPQGKSNTLLITKHLKNIFETGELKEEVASSILEHTTQHGAMEGKTQETKVKYYNLMQLFLLATG